MYVNTQHPALLSFPVPGAHEYTVRAVTRKRAGRDGEITTRIELAPTSSRGSRSISVIETMASVASNSVVVAVIATVAHELAVNYRTSTT